MAATPSAPLEPDALMLSAAAAAEPTIESPEATLAAAGLAGEACAEQTAVLPVVAAGTPGAPANQEPGAQDPGSKPKEVPVKIGFKVFHTAESALRYFYDLIKCLRREQDINEYEHRMVLDLLEQGHPAAAQKVGCGVAAFQIMRHMEAEEHSDCFYVIRTDGSREDFSVKKSVAGLFPGWAKSVEGRQPQPPSQPARGRGRGGRGAARDGGRGPGRGPGRGRAGGRGGGRGGRGFRARGRGRGRGRG